MKKSETPRKSPQQARSQAMVESILAATARILVERGYARTNTNLIAEAAGISVGSLYQYFPNKDALIVALHQRHEEQIQQMIQQVLRRLQQARPPLRTAMRELIGAWMEAHLLAPELHRLLEAEAAFFALDATESALADQRILAGIRDLLAVYGISPLNLKTYLVTRTVENLVHSAVIAPPADFSPEQLAEGLLEMVMAYLAPSTQKKIED